MTDDDTDKNTDKERGEKNGVLDTERAKKLDKTKDGSEDDDAEE